MRRLSNDEIKVGKVYRFKGKPQLRHVISIVTKQSGTRYVNWSPVNGSYVVDSPLGCFAKWAQPTE